MELCINIFVKIHLLPNAIIILFYFHLLTVNFNIFVYLLNLIKILIFYNIIKIDEVNVNLF